jgi:hypothetical protein
MTGGGYSVGHESLYNDSLGIYQLFMSGLRSGLETIILQSIATY